MRAGKRKEGTGGLFVPKKRTQSGIALWHTCVILCYWSVGRSHSMCTVNAPIHYQTLSKVADHVYALAFYYVNSRWIQATGLCIPSVAFFLVESRRGEMRTQNLNSHLVRTQSLNVLPLKPEGGQYIAINASITARDFFLAYFYPSGPFTCIFSKTYPDFSSVGCG